MGEADHKSEVRRFRVRRTWWSGGCGICTGQDWGGYVVGSITTRVVDQLRGCGSLPVAGVHRRSGGRGVQVGVWKWRVTFAKSLFWELW